VELFELGMEAFVLLVLPLTGRRITEKNPAAEGADAMDAANPADLQRAAPAGPTSN